MSDAPPSYRVEFAGTSGREIDVVAGTEGIWRWHFGCGSRPVKPGGGIQLFCEVPKFWLASCVQSESPDAPGYVRVCGSSGLKFSLTGIQRNWKALAWATVSLPEGMMPGQELTVEFGSESFPCYCVAHKYEDAPISWRVDYEATDRFYRIWPPMVVRVVPGPAAKLYLVAPSVVAGGEEFTVRGRAEDANSNIGAALDAPITLELVDSDGNAVAGFVRQVRVSDKGTFTDEGWCVERDGIYRVRATVEGLPQALSNPLRVSSDASPKVAWGDCHCHTAWADGTGTLDCNVTYARDEAFLDVFGFTEHLSNDLGFLARAVDKTGTDWAVLGPHVAECIRRAYKPGRFVTILGHEYTPEYSLVDGKTDFPSGDFCVFSPSDTWRDVPMAHEYVDLIGLARRQNCLAVPHVGGRWPRWAGLPIDPQVTPLVEIASMHGHFEGYAQQGLQAGHKLGFVGMSDGHFGMPGYDNWAQHGRTPDLKHRNYCVQSAITAFLVTEFTREAVFDAMRNRRTYATTGQRILLDFDVSGVGMGQEVSTDAKPRLKISVHGTGPIALVDVIRGDRRVHRIEGNGRTDLSVEWEDPSPVSGEIWYYVRVTQENFSLAWSSPVWVTWTGGEGATEADVAGLPAWDAGPHWPADSPETCDSSHTERLNSIFAKRGMAERFRDIHQVGVFAEPRGRFAMFRAKDSLRDNQSVHIHLYIDFKDDRIYIADGESDYGASMF